MSEKDINIINLNYIKKNLNRELNQTGQISLGTILREFGLEVNGDEDEWVYIKGSDKLHHITKQES